MSTDLEGTTFDDLYGRTWTITLDNSTRRGMMLVCSEEWGVNSNEAAYRFLNSLILGTWSDDPELMRWVLCMVVLRERLACGIDLEDFLLAMPPGRVLDDAARALTEAVQKSRHHKPR
jgi:hypothetical protein